MKPDLDILIVDDSRTSRLLASAMIKAAAPQANIREAVDAEAAILALNSSQPTLVVMDMHMPGMSGLELAAHIGQLAPGCVRALLTANIQDALRRQAEALDVHFFKKPITEQVIQDILALVH